MKFKIFLAASLLLTSAAFSQTNAQNQDGDEPQIFSINAALKKAQEDRAQIQKIKDVDAGALKKFISNPDKMKSIPAMGGHDGNGGDPRVAEFLGSFEDFCQWMIGHPLYDRYANQCSFEQAQLADSVNLNSRIPRVISTLNLTLDHGVAKDVVCDVEYRTITINIDRWQREDSFQHEASMIHQVSLLLGMADPAQITQDYLRDKRDGEKDCMTIQKSMGKMRDSYLSTMNSCYEMEQNHQVGSSNYQLFSQNARDVEGFYPTLLQQCRLSCGNSKVCDGPQPHDACQGKGH